MPNWREEKTGAIVPATGPSDPKIIIIGARPGDSEVLKGLPFIGPSGALLWKLLSIPRSSCYVTNVCKDYHPTRSVPTLKELKDALPSLKAELESVNCSTILALGNEALYALTEKWGIDKLRGSILPCTLIPGRRVIACWHPANILRAYERVYTFDADLRRAIQLAENPSLSSPKRIYHLAPPLSFLLPFLKGLRPPIYVDIECPRSVQDVIYCIGLSDNPIEGVSIPLVGGFYQIPELEAIFRHLDTLFSLNEVRGQNIIFDVGKLENLGFRVSNIGGDTMLKHHLLWPEAGLKLKDAQGKDNFSGGHSLAFITSTHTLEPYYKDEGEMVFINGKLDWERYLTYNLKDVLVTAEIDRKLDEELDEFNQSTYYQKHVNSLLRPIQRMQQRGLLVDTQQLVATRERLNLEARVLQKRLECELGYRVNLKSTNDKRWLLYTHLGFKPSKSTKKGGWSTDEETFRHLSYNSPYRQLLSLCLEIINKRTLLSGFFNLSTGHDRRYRASYLIHGTDSGRLSSRGATSEGGKGPQLQNIPKTARKIFIAPEGYKLVQADLSKAEAMYVAYDSQDENLIKVFEKGVDLYCEWASEVLQRPITKESPERHVFKSAAHASHYGIGWLKFIRTLRKNGIDIEDIQILNLTQPKAKAEFILSSYQKRFPGIKKWQAWIRAELVASRTLYNSFGRRRFFMGRLADIDRIAYSYRPQSSVVDITNQAIVRLDAEGWLVIFQVHDSVGIECPISQLEECYSSLQRAFYNPITLHGRTFNIPIDISVGDNWGEMKEIKL